MTKISDWSDVAAQIQETKELLEEIDQRFQQIQRGLVEQQELLLQQEQLRSQIQQSDLPNIGSKIRRKPNSKSTTDHSPINTHREELLKQLQELESRLEEIEGEIESRLISWSSFQEPFWQVVRFVGLGIVIGVILRSCAG